MNPFIINSNTTVADISQIKMPSVVIEAGVNLEAIKALPESVIDVTFKTNVNKEMLTSLHRRVMSINFCADNPDKFIQYLPAYVKIFHDGQLIRNPHPSRRSPTVSVHFFSVKRKNTTGESIADRWYRENRLDKDGKEITPSMVRYFTGQDIPNSVFQGFSSGLYSNSTKRRCIGVVPEVKITPAKT